MNPFMPAFVAILRQCVQQAVDSGVLELPEGKTVDDVVKETEWEDGWPKSSRPLARNSIKIDDIDVYRNANGELVIDQGDWVVLKDETVLKLAEFITGPIVAHIKEPLPPEMLQELAWGKGDLVQMPIETSPIIDAAIEWARARKAVLDAGNLGADVSEMPSRTPAGYIEKQTELANAEQALVAAVEGHQS